MGLIASLLTSDGAPADTDQAAQQLGEWTGLAVYARSVVVHDGALYALGREGAEKSLIVVGDGADFSGQAAEVDDDGQTLTVKVGPTDAANAAALREHLPSMVARPVGIETASFGSGDRLGIATPGHVRAIRGTGVLPIFAQQSMREMERTGRTPQQVMDEAIWGLMQEGWHEGFGSDADHLKTPEDVAVCAAAGFTMFTIDPGDHVDNAGQTDSVDVLREKFAQLPWDDLQTTADECLAAYAGKTIPGGATMDEEQALRAAVKYANAVVHTVRMYESVVRETAGRPFELEMSVDETDTPTSVAEHHYVASELRRLGVEWVSLAPRFVGKFEKGVDFQGDMAELERTFADHVAVARELGPYKLSLHSGSDKFSVYPIAARLAGQHVHVKTAGTSYLEALRALAGIEPGLFREILEFSRSRYGEDKASYHVSADTGRVPTSDALADDQLAGILDLFDGRQMLHVTYGSVLQEKDAAGAFVFYDRFMAALRANEEAHYDILVRHFRRHIDPFKTT